MPAWGVLPTMAVAMILGWFVMRWVELPGQHWLRGEPWAWRKLPSWCCCECFPSCCPWECVACVYTCGCCCLCRCCWPGVHCCRKADDRARADYEPLPDSV